MATFTHGLNTVLHLGGLEITTYFNSSSIDSSKETVETTAFGSTSKTYIPGLRDATASLEGMFDGTISAALDAALAAASGKAYTFFPEGDAVTKYGFGLLAIDTGYAVSSGMDDVNKVSAEFQANGGADRIECLHPSVSEAATGNGTTVDDSASNADGGVGYLQVESVGTSADVKIQHSTNGTVWTDLITFATATAQGGQRITVPGTVNRYVRAIWTLTGAAAFQVSFGRGLPTTP